MAGQISWSAPRSGDVQDRAAADVDAAAISDDSTLAVAESIAVRMYLDLSGNAIGDMAATAIAERLTEREFLNLRGNAIEEMSANTIADHHRNLE